MNQNVIKILPSLLAADFGNLEAGARKAAEAGGDGLHMDVMDGHFVPNITMGPDVVRMAKRAIKIPLNVHLMISNPDKMAKVFGEAGAGSILIHIEVSCDIKAVLHEIRGMGIRPGITLSPDTPAEAIFPVLGDVDEVLCMTVRPGFGGQKFIPEVLPKIRKVRAELRRIGRNADVLVDGGINPETAVQCAAHGANVFVAGVYLYRSSDMAGEIAHLRKAAAESFK